MGKSIPAIIAAGLSAAIGLAASGPLSAIKPVPARPLSLDAVGSFFIGGRSVARSASQTGVYGDGHLTVDQMYVEYMVPHHAAKPAVVLVHGGTLSGASYGTTPDGRMGWYEYFARQGYPSYLVDQVGRGRSGFDHAIFNDVRSGAAAPGAQPNLRRVAEDVAWVRFRFGPRGGEAFPDTQFPVKAAEDFAKQSVPDLSSSASSDEANHTALIALGRKLGNSVIIAHSQSGQFPFQIAMRDESAFKALVAIEPAGCNARGYSDAQIAKLARVPIMVVFGDHLDTPQAYGANWLPFFQDCQAFVARLKAAKGNARILHTVDLGIHGNSHMLMQDRNNLQIADLIMAWIDRQ